MVKYHGVDLLQHITQVAGGHESAPGKLTTSIYPCEERLPAVGLPLYPGEKLLKGPTALKHRRGMGLPWPPEAQAPFNLGPLKDGVGRIPLIAAWNKLVEAEWGTTSSKNIQDFTWYDIEKKPHKFSPEEILAQSAFAFAEPSKGDKLATIVPDWMSDGSLHKLKNALVKQGNSHRILVPGEQKHNPINLLWRSAAMAIQWCKHHKESILDKKPKLKPGQKLGNIICISLGLDLFEVAVCGIEVREYEKELWLVPIINREGAPFTLGPWGITLLTAMGLTENLTPKTGDKLWNRICGSNWPTQRLQDTRPFDGKLLNGLFQFDELTLLETAVEKEPFLRNLVHTHLEDNEGYQFYHAMLNHIFRQQKLLGGDFRNTLGLIVDGTMTSLQRSSSRTIGDTIALHLQEDKGINWNGNHFIQGTGDLAAQGAAQFAWCAATGRPTYLERIIPIEIYAETTDELGDPAPSWTPLVDRIDIEGGRPYHRVKPIEGFQIKDGTDKLRFVLKRKSSGENIYRGVAVQLEEATSQDEKVELHVAVSAGQGYPTVEVRSKTRGLFSENLDWDTMENKAEPKLTFSYIKEVFIVEAQDDLWEEGVHFAKEVLRTNPKRNFDPLMRPLTQWRGEILNKKAMCPQGRNYTYIGPISSDGSAPLDHPSLFEKQTQSNDELLKGIIDKLSELYSNAPEHAQKEFIRTTGWMYTRMPNSLMNVVRKQLQDVKRFPHDSPLSYSMQRERDYSIRKVWDNSLIGAGQAFQTKTDFRLLFDAAAVRFNQTMDGTNDWLRALRNVVQYRQQALSPRCVSRGKLDFITQKVTQRLGEQEAQGNFKVIFDNCQRIVIFLLKRRRYERDFLSIKNNTSRELERILTEVRDAKDTSYSGDDYPKAYQKRWAKVILAFLKETATGQDEGDFLQLIREE